jgi:UDP-glucose 4-epimerase
LKILVIGGAGYIGSHMVKMLHLFGCNVTTLDNLSSGYRESVLFGNFVEGDMANFQLLDNLLSQRFDAVMHFASFIQVGESVINPEKYYLNNFSNTLNVLNAMKKHGITKFIFSSTAATFGEPQYIPIDEMHPQRPINPYGRTKLMVEQALADYDRAYGIKFVCLRYFNAAGADPEGLLGERHDPETHLIPLVLQVASGRRSHITVFGQDYNTLDGTCVRDYIHVYDLCSAHWLALQSLFSGAESQSYNLGNGNGFSVKQVINSAIEVSKKPVLVLNGLRRDGDPECLVANSTLAIKKLGWVPRYSDLNTIISHAWNWEQKICKSI